MLELLWLKVLLLFLRRNSLKMFTFKKKKKRSFDRKVRKNGARFVECVYLFITIIVTGDFGCICVCVHILLRRRSAALCMIKPCIGYDFCLSHIHIHGRLSGRMYKIVAPTLTAAASAAAAVSVPPATPSEVCVCVCVHAYAHVGFFLI